MSVITTDFNDNAQTPLGRFVVYFMQPTLQQIEPIELRPKLRVASSTIGAISSSPSSTTSLITVNRVP